LRCGSAILGRSPIARRAVQMYQCKVWLWVEAVYIKEAGDVNHKG
jgi:hypothetical protein